MRYNREKHRPLTTTDEQIRDRMSREERSQSGGVIVLGEACAHQGLGMINHRFLKHSQPGLLNLITTDLLGCWRVRCRILAASLYSTHQMPVADVTVKNATGHYQVSPGGQKDSRLRITLTHFLSPSFFTCVQKFISKQTPRIPEAWEKTSGIFSQRKMR